jgi:hypothetical protein
MAELWAKFDLGLTDVSWTGSTPNVDDEAYSLQSIGGSTYLVTARDTLSYPLNPTAVPTPLPAGVGVITYDNPIYSSLIYPGVAASLANPSISYDLNTLNNPSLNNYFPNEIGGLGSSLYLIYLGKI